jgi:hypothetical protein
MFYLQVASAANLVRADDSQAPLPHDIEMLRMRYHSRGSKMLLKELDRLRTRKGVADDALIMATVMGALVTDPEPTQFHDSFRLSPLATAQNLHLYAKLQLMPAQIGALLDLVSKRGGLRSLREFGNAQMLQL